MRRYVTSLIPSPTARERARGARDPGRRGGAEGYPGRVHPEYRRGDTGGSFATQEGRDLIASHVFW